MVFNDICVITKVVEFVDIYKMCLLKLVLNEKRHLKGWRFFGIVLFLVNRGYSSDTATSFAAPASFAAMSAVSGVPSALLVQSGFNQRSSQRKNTLCQRMAF